MNETGGAASRPGTEETEEEEEDLPITNGISQVSLDEAARDDRDEPLPLTPPTSATRPASPYTLNPPIDFDGLSWPSERLRLYVKKAVS